MPTLVSVGLSAGRPGEGPKVGGEEGGPGIRDWGFGVLGFLGVWGFGGFREGFRGGRVRGSG